MVYSTPTVIAKSCLVVPCSLPKLALEVSLWRPVFTLDSNAPKFYHSPELVLSKPPFAKNFDQNLKLEYVKRVPFSCAKIHEMWSYFLAWGDLYKTFLFSINRWWMWWVTSIHSLSSTQSGGIIFNSHEVNSWTNLFIHRYCGRYDTLSVSS